MKNINKRISFTSIFTLLFTIFSINGVFAAKKITELATTDNMLAFFKNMQWMNWVIYIALIFIVGNVLTQVLGGSKSAKMGSYLISFMGITGFMWVLILNRIFPTHLMLWVAEIFVLIFAGLIIKLSFTLSNGKEGFIAKTKWIGLFFAALIINQFNGMLLNFATTVKVTGGNYFLIPDSTLYQVANTLHLFEMPVGGLLLFLVGWIVISLIGETNVAREKVAGPLVNYVKNNIEYNKKHDLRLNLMKEVGELYKKLRGMKNE